MAYRLVVSRVFGLSGTIRHYPGTCIAFLQMGSASASTLAGSYTIVERP